ncbi:aftiphilin [Esox lucius]|uniref:aftiphilin n=1 Tax=Esox lucius TaxID=8010 RepID=UPI0014777FEA|nr:aftiphilin [Esox lucius]XP_028975905.2 aftiphilin [Esox lucius]XP_028975906.2 aftiphilin [Esox lucius]XP_034148299.1 aftiphilin [Esox lucius]XP_034148300.1 aftiphilin [Esox lucius]
MEQEVMRIYSSSPPAKDDESGGEEEEDDNLGVFSGGVASVRGVTVSSSQHHSLTTGPVPPTPSTDHSAVRNPALADAGHNNGTLTRGTGDLKRPQAMDPSQPDYSVTSEFKTDRSGLEVKGRHCHCDLPERPLTNGLFEQHYQGTMSTGPVPAGLRGPSQESGFADFSVFTEPEMDLEAWCCGFSHTGTTEHQKNGRTKGSNLTNGFCEGHSLEEDTEQEPGGEPDPLCLEEPGHCKLTGLEPILPSQGLSAPQERFPAGGEELGGPGESGNRTSSTSWHGTLRSLTQDPELGAGREEDDEEEETEPEESVSSLPTTVSASVSEEFASFCEAVFPDALEELGDFAETVFVPSSPGEKEEKEAEKEVVEIEEKEETEKEVQQSNRRENPKMEAANLEKKVNNGTYQEGFTDLSQSESMTQEGFSNFNQSVSENHKGLADSDQDNPDLTQTNPDLTQTCEDNRGEEWGEGVLPPSDSFADFHSAPLKTSTEEQGDTKESCWAFGEQRGLLERESWAEFGEERNYRTEEEEGSASVRRDRLKASLSIRLLRILQTSFPSVTFPELDQSGLVGLEEDMGLEEKEQRSVELVPSLRVLLEALDTQPEEGKTEEPQLSTTHWVPRGAWRQPQDVHDAVGLGFQWGGSHSNRALLHCLGMDTWNMEMLESHQVRAAPAAEEAAFAALPGSQDTTTSTQVFTMSHQ